MYQFTSEELKYLKTILEQSSSYAQARGEEINHPTVRHKTIIAKIEDQLTKLHL